MGLAIVLSDIIAERQRQDDKWGADSGPAHNVDPEWLELGDATIPTTSHVAALYGIPSAMRAKFLCDKAHLDGRGTWGHILVEEVAEAIEAATIHDLGITANGRSELRAELIQVAAV